ncbi:MAG: nedA1 [Streptomyces oryziradicis]|nr:nedA1 [Actinacidiphila oryziradicis]
MTRHVFKTGRALTGLALLATGALGWESSAQAGPKPRAACTQSVPFRSGTEGYDTFRIPAALMAGRNTLLAFAEGRKNSAADDGDIDTVLRRSSDGGCTWGRLQVIADGGADTLGNPAPVADPRTGRVVLLLCRTTSRSPNRRVYVLHSNDNGATWTRPREITSAVKRPDWRWYATGPGHAIALRRGPHAGRLLAAANHSTASETGTGTGPESGSHSLYSDDGGDSWHIGYVADLPGGRLKLNEGTLAELPDGRVYVNVRDQGGFSQAGRADAYSSDGGRTISGAFRPQKDLTGPVVQGSLLQTDGGPLLYSGPSDPQRRARMAVRVSRDGGRTWTAGRTISTRPAGYSDLLGLGGRSVGLLYETGVESPYETITFTRFTVPAD